MSGKPVVLRERARRDIDEAVEHYLAEAGEAVALDFIDALEDTRRRIGSPDSRTGRSGSGPHSADSGEPCRRGIPRRS